MNDNDAPDYDLERMQAILSYKPLKRAGYEMILFGKTEGIMFESAAANTVGKDIWIKSVQHADGTVATRYAEVRSDGKYPSDDKGWRPLPS